MLENIIGSRSAHFRARVVFFGMLEEGGDGLWRNMALVALIECMTAVVTIAAHHEQLLARESAVWVCKGFLAADDLQQGATAACLVLHQQRPSTKQKGGFGIRH